jgi:hypothetical protein
MIQGQSCIPIIIVILNPHVSTSIVVTRLSSFVSTPTIVAMLDSYVTSLVNPVPHPETTVSHIHVA